MASTMYNLYENHIKELLPCIGATTNEQVQHLWQHSSSPYSLELQLLQKISLQQTVPWYSHVILHTCMFAILTNTIIYKKQLNNRCACTCMYTMSYVINLEMAFHTHKHHQACVFTENWSYMAVSGYMYKCHKICSNLYIGIAMFFCAVLTLFSLLMHNT